MENKNLRETLERLHLELLLISTTDKSLQEKRDALVAHIRQSLDQESFEEYHLALKQIISEQIFFFEATHPKVTELMNSVNSAISSIGI